MDTAIDRASSGIAATEDAIEDIQTTKIQQSEVVQLARPRSSCLSKELQRERSTKQMVGRTTVREHMMTELNKATTKNILRERASGRPCIIADGLYWTSTSETPEGRAKLHIIASRRSVPPEQLQFVPEHTW